MNIGRLSQLLLLLVSLSLLSFVAADGGKKKETGKGHT